MEDEERRSLNGSETNLKDKYKCAICDFETGSHDIYRNHMVFHATKDQDSPPPTSLPAPSNLPLNLPTPSIPLPQYPLQIRSPLAINAGAKAAAAAAAAASRLSHPGLSHLLKRTEHGALRPDIRPESGAESPSSSNNVKQEGKSSEPSLDYLEYLKKVAPFFKQTMSQPSGSPSGISSTQTGSPPLTSTSELISRLYFGNMVKNLSQLPPERPQQPQPTQRSQLQSVRKSPKPSAGNQQDADSSSGALDLSQLNKPGIGDDSPMPSRPQSGSQTSTTGSGSGKSRRKGKAFKIERKLLTSGDRTDHCTDRDSLNSGPSEYDVDEVKSDGSSGSGKEATTTGTNGDHHTAMDEDTTIPGESGKPGLSGSHVCKFCEIAFMDSIMYTIHMGYHGFQNPYKCNMCGEELEDRVGFFLHIGRNAHR